MRLYHTFIPLTAASSLISLISLSLISLELTSLELASARFISSALFTNQAHAHPGHLARGEARGEVRHHAETRSGAHSRGGFEQLDSTWPTPSEVRLASGAPGPAYWQQRVDYQIDATLNDQAQSLSGSALITYHNNSPHTLRYLWVQLEQNRFKLSSADHLTRTFRPSRMYYGALSRRDHLERRRPGFHLAQVSDAEGVPLSHKIVGTMMRIDLPSPLLPQTQTRLIIKWTYPIMRHRDVWARAGYEDLKPLAKLDTERRALLAKLKPSARDPLPLGGESDQALAGPPLEASETQVKRRIYEVAQWYPRLAAYTDFTGWQHKPFLGGGEFTLEFGDFEVNITAPDTFTVAATGELMNSDEVLTPTQRVRLNEAKSADRPQWIITPEEAREQSARAPQSTKTWRFKAAQVRDFAFAASNSYLWDAMGYRSELTTPDSPASEVLTMSFYPPEAAALWSRYSTHAVAHALKSYERFTFRYPYPTAISVNGPVFGMEYPMITFNGVRPELDDTYSKNAKYNLIGVIIHEVGHFFFPMIVNSDERQWTWLDEGINSFVQFQAERAWEHNFPSWHGKPEDIAEYMMSERHQPIMTNSDSLIDMGSNAYSKTAAALSVLRETVIGPDLFDDAFREYARRWRFKRPAPSDFFRTIEDVSGANLDWFWRSWFYSTAHVDVEVKELRRWRLKRQDPTRDKAIKRDRKRAEGADIFALRDEGRELNIERYPELQDFYNSYDPLVVTDRELKRANSARAKMKRDQPERVRELENKRVFYELILVNRGGVVTPIPLRLTFDDGSAVDHKIPAEVWRKNAREVKLLLNLERPLRSVYVDPYHEIGDRERDNNRFPRGIADVDTLELKDWRATHPQRNPMRDSRLK